MKAIRIHNFGAPEELKLEDVPDPRPEKGQILVKVHAAGVNPVDTYIRSGSYKIKPPLPYIPGSDCAGMVEETGEGVFRFRKGDRVYTSGSVTGAYAEKCLCTEAQVHPLPASLCFTEGAAIGVPYATAYRALWQKACARPGDIVLVHGASGSVGSAAVQIARAAGMTVFGTAGTEKGRKLVKEAGAQHVFDHHTPDYLQKIRETANGRGPDIILEMLANVNLQKDLEVLAPRGRVVVIGCRGEIAINPRLMMSSETTVIGMTLFNASPEELAVVHAGLYAGFENGTLKPFVGTELSLKDAAKAHHDIMEKPAHGKIVLKI